MTQPATATRNRTNRLCSEPTVFIPYHLSGAPVPRDQGVGLVCNKLGAVSDHHIVELPHITDTNACTNERVLAPTSQAAPTSRRIFCRAVRTLGQAQVRLQWLAQDGLPEERPLWDLTQQQLDDDHELVHLVHIQGMAPKRPTHPCESVVHMRCGTENAASARTACWNPGADGACGAFRTACCKCRYASE